jgi:hypothetical protein
MARTRQIKPRFFLNTELSDLDPLCRLLFIGLWTIADRHGRLKLNPKKIKAEILPYEDLTCTALVRFLHQLTTKGFISTYRVNGEDYLQIVNFEKHQHVHRDEKSCGFPLLEDGELVVIELDGENYLISTVLASYNNGSSTALAPNLHALKLIDVNGEIVDSKSNMTESTPVDYRAVELSWNAFAESVGLPKVRELTVKRKRHIKMRLQQNRFDAQAIYDKVKDSKFLLGDNDRGWRCDFDFVWASADNWVKILEGKYEKANYEWTVK